MTGNALTEEPKELAPHHVYQGGSAPGVSCANCHTDNTSGSWRRGWVLNDKTNANLCNRCGQRWVKLGRAAGRDLRVGALDATVRAAGSKSGPGLSAAMDAGDLAPNRFRLGAGMVQSSTGFHGALNHGVLPLPVRHRLLSENTADTSDTGAVDSPTTDGLGIFGDVGELPNGPSLNLSGAYCVQKMSSGRAAYALFWAVGAAGTCTLAAVGVDPRSSGHFTYTHAPALASRVTPLRCTNRSDVVAWLSASFGVERALPEAMVRPPSISVEELERMLGRQGSAPLVVPVESVVGAPQPQPLVDLGINGQSYRSPTKQLLHGAKIKPQARMLPKFKCGVCGRDDHGSEECLLSCLSPPALVHNDVADELMLLDVPALSGADAVEDFFMRTAGNDDDSPMQQDSTFNISAFEAAMPATTSPGPVTQFRAGAGTQVAMPPLDPPTAAASAHQPDLLRWVAALPPQGVEDTVAAWARLLSGHISDTQPPGGVSEAWMPAGGVRWVPTGEALAVLHQLSLMEVDLALLEKTQVSRAVAVLRAHPSPLIAKAAEHIADKWRTMAMNALQKATTVGARLP